MSITMKHRPIAHCLLGLVSLCVATIGGLSKAQETAGYHPGVSFKLMSSSPTESARLHQAPNVITLTFNKPVLAEQGKITVHSGLGGNKLSKDLPVTVDRNTMSAIVPYGSIASGANVRVGVQWEAHSDRQEPLSGLFTFTVQP